MNDATPPYLSPLILTEALATITVLLSILSGTLKLAQFPGDDRRRATLTGSSLLITWFLVALITSWFGFYGGVSNRLPTIQFGLIIPILAGIAMFWSWPSLRRIIEVVPQQWIVSVQFYRVLGAIFLVLYAQGRMPGAFALPAGIGDVIVGLSSPFVATAYARKSRGSAGMLRAWNLFGILDLVVAATTGFLSSPSPLQMLALDQPNTLISVFPLAIIPVFLVPLAVLLHLASLAKLRQTHVRQATSPTVAPAHTR